MGYTAGLIFCSPNHNDRSENVNRYVILTVLFINGDDSKEKHSISRMFLGIVSFVFFITCLPRNVKLASVGKYINFMDIGRPIWLIFLLKDTMVATDAGWLQLYNVRNISYGVAGFWYYENSRKGCHIVDVPNKPESSVVGAQREELDADLENESQVVEY